MPIDSIITARNLSVGYDKRVVLSQLELDVKPGSFTVLIGANGSGKSTLLRTISGVQAPLWGELLYCGRAADELSRRQKARFVAMVSTERQGGSAFTVRETVELGRFPHAGLFERLVGTHACAVELAMAAVGVQHMSDRHIGTLSDGERQKVMIAAALAQDTPFIILDEPTAFLDVAARIEVMKVLRDLADNGRAILLSTHDIAPAIAAADNLWVVDPMAQTVISGAKNELIAQGALDRAFPDKPVRFDIEKGDFA